MASRTAVFRADWENEGLIWFKHTSVDEPPPPPPPSTLAGCTPGFWRQSQHYQYWTAPYAPGLAFSSVFSDAGQVVQLGGGGLNALGRHTVAALLNAASGDVDYGMSPDEVVATFNAAYASGDYEAQKNVFAAANERGCTVNKSNDGRSSTGSTDGGRPSHAGSPAGKGKNK